MKNEGPFLNLSSVKIPKKSAKKVIKQESFNTFGKNEEPAEQSESLGNTSDLNGSEMKGFDMDKKSSRKRAAENDIEDLDSFAKPNSILKVGSQTSKACRNVNFNESFKDYIEKDNMLTPMNNGRINTRFAQNQLATTPRETPRVQATIPTQLKLQLTSEVASNYTVNKKGCISESPAYIYT